LRRPLRLSRLKSTTNPRRSPTWTSPRNPQTSPHSRNPSGTLPPVFRQPLRPLSLPNALVFNNRPHTPPQGLVPPPPATPTPLAKRKGRKKLTRLHPHPHLRWSGPPPQLTWISRDMTCQLPLAHCTATLRRLPKNTLTPGKRKNSLKENIPQVPPGHPSILTPTGSPPPPWPPRPPLPTPKLLHPLPKARRVVRRRVLPRLPQLRSRRVRFLGNLPLLSPKPSGDSSPPEPPSNPTQKRLRLQLISRTSLPLYSERLIAPFPFPSLARLTTKVWCHCSVPTFTPTPPLIPLISLPLPRG